MLPNIFHNQCPTSSCSFLLPYNRSRLSNFPCSFLLASCHVFLFQIDEKADFSALLLNPDPSRGAPFAIFGTRRRIPLPTISCNGVPSILYIAAVPILAIVG